MADKKYELDKDMEAEAQKVGAYPVKPVVTQIHQKMGLFNFIRNAKNAMEVKVHKAEHADDPE